jgi:ubiquinone/menaquinone biosynthesis C-methylase UbiE
VEACDVFHKLSSECPWWFIRSFDNPLRRLVQDPEKILREFVRPGDACLDIGCGIGYFTIPLAGLTGPSGRVTAVDLQPEMLAGVAKRAKRAGLSDRIRLHQADASGLQLDGSFDFTLAFWMVHEVPDQAALFRQIRELLNPGGHMLLVEPIGHVRRAAFQRTLATLSDAGLVVSQMVAVRLSRAVLLTVSGGATGSPDTDR